MDTEQIRSESEKDRLWGEAMQKDAEKAIEREQSHTSKLLEHHLKIQSLERKVAFLQGEIDRMEARKRDMTKALTIFCCGVCYGLILVWILNS